MNADPIAAAGAADVQTFSILLVEDDDDFRDSCCRWLSRKGYDVEASAGGAEAISACQRRSFDVGLFDMDMPGMSGLELLQRLREDGNDLEVVILTGQGSIETAVQAMKLGACDFLTKPCPLGELEHHLRLANGRGELRRENKQLKQILSRSHPKIEVIGACPAMVAVKQIVTRIAPTDQPVLITGESGTGKEVIAQAIQQASNLADKPFVTVNCAALPESLVESELFGHQRGSFTGATEEKPGLFEVADGGTLFIDELGELPPSLQPKLLRVLEDGSLRRIGSAKERKVRVRIIAATNRDLAAAVRMGEFREDLYYRVNVLPIHLPPLRDRGSDLDSLVGHFLPGSFHVDDEAMTCLRAHRWPGNVRELQNVLNRAVILADRQEITVHDLPDDLVTPVDFPMPARQHGDAPESSNGSLQALTKQHVLKVLRDVQGNKSHAARRLGIHRRKLYRLLESFETQQT
ncbi:MAG: sigma-54 dependent transcriptional regulator [Planctomycetota bacterium]